MDLLERFLKYKKQSKDIKEDTIEMYKIDMRDFTNYFSEKNILDITQDDVIDYVKYMKEKYQQNSITRKMSSLKSFYRYLAKEELIDEIPTDGIILEKAVEKEPEKLEKWEVEMIINQCDKTEKGIRDRLLLELLVETGITINDALRVETSDLELNSYKELVKIDGRGKIKLSKEMQEKIKEYLQNGKEYKFLFGTLTRQNFRSRFIQLGEKAGIEREISPNMLMNLLKELRKHDEENDVTVSDEEIKRKYFEIGIGDE